MLLWLFFLQVAAPPNQAVDGPVPAPVVLEGVIVTHDAANAVALLRAGEAHARPVRVGESIAGYVLAEVSRDSVLLRSADGVVRIYVQGMAPKTASVDDRLSWERREFPRAEAKVRLEREIPVILDEMRLTPRVEEGEVRGLSLERLPDGTLLSESGLLPGDVLLSLNGEPLHSLTELWGLLARLAAEDVDELRLVVERRGEERRLAYALTR